MTRMVASVSIPLELQPLVRGYTDNGGNLSGLVCRLLEGYFKTGSDPRVDDILISELSNQFSSMHQELGRLQTELQALHARKEESRAAGEKKRADLLPLIEEQFDDIRGYRNIREWQRALGGNDRASQAARIRCSLVATKGGVSAEAAKAAIIEKYPELEAYL